MLTAALLLQLPNAIAAFLPEPSLAAWRDLCVGLFLLMLPVLLGLRMRFWFRLCVLLVPLVPAVTAYYLSSQTMPAVWSLLALYETDVSELSRFGGPLVAVAVATPALLWLYWSGLTRFMTEEPTVAARLGLTVLLLAPIPVTILRGEPLRKASWEAVIRQANGYPTNVILAYQRAGVIQSCLGARDAVCQTAEVTAPPALPQGKREIHVLVLGESARFKSFQLGSETTPLLSARKDLISFQEAVAPACMTGLSVPALITPVTAPNITDAASFPSVSALFRKAGYSTWWLSSQRKHGAVDTRCSLYAGDAEHAHFVSSKLTAQFTDYRSALDGELLPLLDKALASESQRLFIVLHTMGSHCLYMDRYPKEFAKHPVDSSKCVDTVMKGLVPIPFMVIDTPEARQQLTNAYTNTLLYTDWILNEVIQRLEKQSGALATMTYVSDHGENDADAAVMPFCHGVIAADTLRVPMFVWHSAAYAAARQAKVQALQQHVATPFCSDTVFHTVLDLAALHGSHFDRTQSAACEVFSPKPRLLVDLNGTTVIDFDKQVLPKEQARKGWRKMTAAAGAP